MGTTPSSTASLVPPGRTPMFENSPSAPGRTFDWALNRTWWIFFEKLAKAAAAGGGGPYVRTLLLKDTTVGNDIADHVPIWVAGTAIRAIAVLRKAITADLKIRVNLDGAHILTVTVPHTTAVDSPVETTAFADTGFGDVAVLSWDVLASDGSQDAAGVCSLTIEWS